MKIEKFIFIFVIIVFSILIVQNNIIYSYIMNEQNKFYFNNVLECVSDILLKNYDLSFGSYDNNRNLVYTNDLLDKFFLSIKNIYNLSYEELLDIKKNIPFIILLDGDGYYVYSLHQMINKGIMQNQNFEYLSEKKYFCYEENNIIFNFNTNGLVNILYYDDAGNLISELRNIDYIISKKLIDVDNVRKFIIDKINFILLTEMKFLLFEYNNYFKKNFDIGEEDINFLENNILIYFGDFNINNRFNCSIRKLKTLKSNLKLLTLYIFKKNNLLYYTNNIKIAQKYGIIDIFYDEKDVLKKGYFKMENYDD